MKHYEQDIIDFNQAKQEAKEFFPQDILDKLCNNDNPVQVFRKYRHMTGEELASACHISRAFLAQIETGKKTGSVKTLKKIATVLKIDLDFLISE